MREQRVGPLLHVGVLEGGDQGASTIASCIQYTVYLSLQLWFSCTHSLNKTKNTMLSSVTM